MMMMMSFFVSFRLFVVASSVNRMLSSLQRLTPPYSVVVSRQQDARSSLCPLPLPSWGSVFHYTISSKRAKSFPERNYAWLANADNRPAGSSKRPVFGAPGSRLRCLKATAGVATTTNEEGASPSSHCHPSPPPSPPFTTANSGRWNMPRERANELRCPVVFNIVVCRQKPASDICFKGHRSASMPIDLGSREGGKEERRA